MNWAQQEEQVVAMVGCPACGVEAGKPCDMEPEKERRHGEGRGPITTIHNSRFKLACYASAPPWEHN